MKKYFEKTKDFLVKNQDLIGPGIKFVGKCVEQASLLSQNSNPSPISYVNAAFKCKEQFDSIFESKPMLINMEKWETFSVKDCWDVIVNILEFNFKSKIKSKKVKDSYGTTTYFVVKLSPTLSASWTEANSLREFLITKGRKSEFLELLNSCSWNMFDTNSIFIYPTKLFGWMPILNVAPDLSHKNFVNTGLIDYYRREIEKFNEKGHGRSIIFYGPPGTGKSNLVKGLANSLNLKTIRIENLSNVGNRALSYIIDIFNPDVVVLEDIDDFNSHDRASLLNKISELNERKKYIFATANEVTKIDSALSRPDRFDQMIEICKNDYDVIRSLVGDDEIFEIIKNYPIAFINEVMKRVESLGKEEALSNMEDVKTRVSKLNEKNYKL